MNFISERFPLFTLQQHTSQPTTTTTDNTTTTTTETTTSSQPQPQQQQQQQVPTKNTKLKAVPVADGAIEADWCKKKLCCISSRSFSRRSDGRKPGDRPNSSDLELVKFSPASDFKPDEVVLVAKSRGGLVYAIIESKSIVQKCYLDPTVAHESIRFRVSYPSLDNCEKLFKDIPPHYIGKLPHVIPNPAQQSRFSTTQEQEINPFQAAKMKRIVGTRVTSFDLSNACFSPQNSLAVGQTVAVPRSAGGFSYGVVLKRHITLCSLIPTVQHEIIGWRIVIKDATETEPHVYKDLPIGVVGKLVLLNENPAPRPAILAPQPLSIQRPSQQQQKQKQQQEEEEEIDEETILWSGEQQLATNDSQTTTTTTTTTVENEGVENKGKNEDEKGDEENENEDDEEAPKCRKEGEIEGEEILLSQIQQPNQTTTTTTKRNGMLSIQSPSTISTPAKTTANKPMIVIDGPNVAVKHSGKKNCLSVSGLKIVIDYYKSRGHDVIAFIPEHFVSRKPIPSNSSGLTLGDFMPVVDNMAEFEELINEKLVVLTPSQDYDDRYTIEFARNHNACIVTNDRFWDHINRLQKGSRDQREYKQWIRSHCISFTFVRDEFLPNPDFSFSNLK